MDNHLKNLHQSYVFAYILDYQPPTPPTDNGAMTIVDNNNNNITSLLSSYGFYIDNIFIAGGYGFKTSKDIKAAKDIVDNFDNIKEEINNQLEDLSNKRTVFAFKGTITGENDSEINSNVLSPEYNTYNFITTYKYLKLSEGNVENSLDYKYTLSIDQQDDIRYIKNLSIESDNDGEDIIEIETLNATNNKKYKVKLTIDQNTSNNVLQYNENLRLYLYSKISEQYKNDEIEYNREASNVILSREFEKPSDLFDDDLVLELRMSNENAEEENIVYSFEIPNFLRWQDNFVIYPKANDIIDTSLNNYNFRDTQTDLNVVPSTINTLYNDFVENYFIEQNFIHVNTSKEIELDFESNTPVYDYIIFRNQYNVEFYFNGIKSNNWKCEEITIRSKTYYIWQSPQKYVGSHTWKIKINV